MRYLLDVNVLVALGLSEHIFHTRVAAWLQVSAASPDLQLLTCATTELGFIRVLTQASGHQITIAQAKAVLLCLKRSPRTRLSFIADDHDASHLPAWVKTAKQTTDGHLVGLAKANGAQLATLDERIPGAYVVPA